MGCVSRLKVANAASMRLSAGVSHSKRVLPVYSKTDSKKILGSDQLMAYLEFPKEDPTREFNHPLTLVLIDTRFWEPDPLCVAGC